MSVTLRDKTTAANQLAVASDGSITASVKGNGAPPNRSMDYWTVDQFTTTTASDALLTVTESVNGAATSTFTSRVVTNGKTMRITSVSIAVEAAGSSPASIARGYFGIRFNTGGAVTTSSPLMWRVGVSVPTSTRTITNYWCDFEDGMEFVGDGTKQIGLTAICADWVTGTTTPKITLSVLAYEY